MENETVLATTTGVPPAVAVRAVGTERFLAAWSTESGTFVAELDERGAPIGPARRIQKGGDGSFDEGVALEAAPKTFWPRSERTSIHSEDLAIAPLNDESAALVMVERPVEDAAGGAYVALISPLSTTAPKVLRIGGAGEYANRITAVECGGDLIVAWHEGMLDSSSVLTARIGLEPLAVKQTSRIKSANALSNPSLCLIGSSALIAWAEIIREGNTPVSLVKVASLTPDLKLEHVTDVARGRFLDPAPQLAPAGDLAGLVFRDDADKDDTPEFYFTLVGPEGKALYDPKRISQADGWRGPSALFRSPNFVAVAIRSFQRNLLVGVNRFDGKGVKLGGEFQVYADKTDFVRVDLAATKSSIAMIYAEDRRGAGRVLTSRVHCGDLEQKAPR